jgi:hypothetical protein
MVDALDSRAVAKVESGHRVVRLVTPLCIEEVACCQPGQAGFQGARQRRVFRPDFRRFFRPVPQPGQRRSRYPLEFEETHVKPCRKPRLKLTVQRTQSNIVLHEAQEIGSQVDEEFHTLGKGVELGQDPQALGPQGGTQGGFRGPLGLGADSLLVFGMGILNGLRVGAEFRGDHAQERRAPLVAEREVGFREACRPDAGRYFPTQTGSALLELIAQEGRLFRTQDTISKSISEQFANPVDTSRNHSFRHFHPLDESGEPQYQCKPGFNPGSVEVSAPVMGLGRMG